MPRAGRRPASTSRVPDPEQLAERRRRAAEEPLDVRLRTREPFVDLEVRNPIHRTSYRVLFPEFPQRDAALCSCTDFARRGLGTCKHVEAGWSWLQGRPELPEPAPQPPRGRPPAEVWPEVESRLERLVREPPATIREAERAASPLFEQAAPGTGPREGETKEKVGRARRPRSASTRTSRART